MSVGVNQLSSLPEQFGKLACLRELYLDFNCISRLPESFGSLEALEVLFLNENRLTQLPASFQKLQKLKKLNLQRNYLKALPEITQFENLTDVYLDDPKSRKAGLLGSFFG